MNAILRLKKIKTQVYLFKNIYLEINLKYFTVSTVLVEVTNVLVKFWAVRPRYFQSTLKNEEIKKNNSANSVKFDWLCVFWIRCDRFIQFLFKYIKFAIRLSTSNYFPFNYKNSIVH